MGVRPRCIMTSTYGIEIGGDVRFWHIASFRCAAEFCRYRGIADTDKPSTRQIYGFTT